MKWMWKHRQTICYRMSDPGSNFQRTVLYEFWLCYTSTCKTLVKDFFYSYLYAKLQLFTLFVQYTFKWLQVLLSTNMEWILDLFLLYTVHPQEKKKKKKKRKETSLDIHFDILAPEEITLVSYLSIWFSVLAGGSALIIF